MTGGEIASTISACANAILAGATSFVAYATMKYAHGTNKIAQASVNAVDAQIAASQALIETNRKLSDATVRAQVVSSTRTNWINAVRDAVAEFLSIDAEVKDSRVTLTGPEFVDNLIQRRMMIHYRIEFRLDPDKPLHVELLKNIQHLMAIETHDVGLVECIRGLTKSIAEEEWRRVRREVGAPVSADAESLNVNNAS